MWQYSELYHHGIKGQKWGVRRYQNEDGRLTSAGKARLNKKTDAQKESERQKRNDSKNRGTLSDKELRQKIERLKLEKELRSLTSSEVSRGRTEIADILKRIGTSTITTAATGALLYAAKAAITRKFDANQFGDAVFRGGAKKK